ncbi:MAG: hypothetical protein ACRCTY_07195 [Candidatus Adiutrix sp.]
MKTKTKCENCATVYYMNPEYTNRTAKCKKCGETFTMAPMDESTSPFFEPSPMPSPPHFAQINGDFPPPVGPSPTIFQENLNQFANQAASLEFQEKAPSTSPNGYLSPSGDAVLQTVVCKKCGREAKINPVARTIKVLCQACGAKNQVKPLPKVKGAKAPAQGSSKIIFLVLPLLLLLAIVFAGPKFFPEIFPDFLASFLP